MKEELGLAPIRRPGGTILPTPQDGIIGPDLRARIGRVVTAAIKCWEIGGRETIRGQLIMAAAIGLYLRARPWRVTLEGDDEAIRNFCGLGRSQAYAYKRVDDLRRLLTALGPERGFQRLARLKNISHAITVADWAWHHRGEAWMNPEVLNEALEFAEGEGLRLYDIERQLRELTPSVAEPQPARALPPPASTEPDEASPRAQALWASAQAISEELEATGIVVARPDASGRLVTVNEQVLNVSAGGGSIVPEMPPLAQAIYRYLLQGDWVAEDRQWLARNPERVEELIKDLAEVLGGNNNG